MTPTQQPVTIMLFKDHLVARSFRVSLSWITRLGVFLTALLAVCLVSFFFALRYYYAAHRADPIRVQALEQQLAEAQANYLTLQESSQKALKEAQSTAAPIPQPGASAAAVALPVTGAQAPVQPIPTVTVTVTATPATTTIPVTVAAPAPAPGAALTGTSYLFSALAPSTQRVEGKPSVGIQHPKLAWVAHSLSLRFNIQYLNEDKGTQQGRIIMIARGPDTVLGYPKGVFKSAGQPTLLSPEAGEYFSVSRVRETKADFGQGGEDLKEVEIILLSLEGKLLVHERFDVPAAPKARPSSKPKTTPAPESTGSSAGLGGTSAPGQGTSAPTTPGASGPDAPTTPGTAPAGEPQP